MFTRRNMPSRGLTAAVMAMVMMGCASIPAERAASAADPSENPGICNAAGAKSHVGKKASEAMGAAILADSGARNLRWGPPRAAWTMDYREDRVNVRYDDDMTIIDITCG